MSAAPLTTSPPPDVVGVWPRRAQVGAAFLLGCMTAFLGLQVQAALRSNGDPTAVGDSQPLTYRVDLNTASRTELMQLPGIGAALAERIEAYRVAHGSFQRVEDLLKVPGIGPTTLERIKPLVIVRADPVAQRQVGKPGPPPAPGPRETIAKKKEAPKGPIDLNTATLEELQTLPGIGPKLSQRIVDERAKKPFASVEELRRVYGIGPKTLEKVRPFVVVGK